VVDYGPPPSCPPCTISPGGQPDLTSLGTPGAAEEFSLSSQADITSIIFWTYELPGVTNVPVEWAITDALSHTVGSGTISSPIRDTPVLVDDLGGDGFDMQVSMITLDLPTPLIITPNPGPENYELGLNFVGDGSSYFWADGTSGHVAFQLIGTESAVVPEPSYVWIAAGGLGLLAAFRIRRKR